MDTPFIETLFDGRETSIARDLKMNMKRLAEDSTLAGADYSLLLLCLSAWRGHLQFKEVGTELVRHNVGVPVGMADAETAAEIIREATEIPAIMTMLNSYYKFRRFLRNADSTADDTYGAAKLRMQSLAQPKMGRERFEMLALAVSIANGCEQCVTSHVEALKKLGVSAEKIHDVARLTSSVLGALSL